MIDLTLTEEQNHLRDEIIRFAKNNLGKAVIQRDKEGVFERALWDKCGEMGLPGLCIPTEYGGSGLDAVSTAIALEALGYGCEDGGLSFSICAHLLACAVPIWKFGNEAQKKQYLPKLANGNWIAVNGMTGPDAGSDAFNMSTRAEKTPEGYVINGRKTFGSNGPVADMAVVYAVTDPDKGVFGGITAFLVGKGPNGFSIGQKYEKMGLRTCPISELVFDEVIVKDDAVLGKPGAGGAIFNLSMEWERALLVATHIGTIQRLLEKGVEYAKLRKSGGQPIGKYQAVSHKIADIKVSLEAARLLVWKAALGLGDKKKTAMDASVAKLFVSETLQKAAMDTLQVFGGYGYMVDFEVERVLRDAIGSTIYSGTSDIQRNMIARWLGL